MNAFLSFLSYGYFIISWVKDEEKERGIKREESKDDDDNEDGSSNNNADEYDPLEAEDADDYDDDGRGPAACTWILKHTFDQF